MDGLEKSAAVAVAVAGAFCWKFLTVLGISDVVAHWMKIKNKKKGKRDQRARKNSKE